MVSFNVFTILAAAVASVAAFPAGTATIGNRLPSRTFLTGVTHTVVVGRSGLHFDPENVQAEKGDLVQFHFLSANHSIAQSDFAHPCKPLADGTGFFAGFNFVTPEGQQNPNVYEITIVDDSTIWYYCPQTKGNHCQVGQMVGVINQNFDGDKTLANHKLLAKDTGVSIVPPVIQGGKVGGFSRANPNPLSGF